MIRRVAYLSMHTSPLLQPGEGDAGGMNVYIDELARTMVGRGVEVDVFTRAHADDLPPVVDVSDGYRVVHVVAGRTAALPIGQQARHVRRYAAGVVALLRGADPSCQIVHSHYWLSGWGGLLVKRALGIPLAHSFHTLGRVKDLTRPTGQPPESLLRIAAEHEVIDGSDCLVASTPMEAEDLMSHYGADPSRICTSPPGVNHEVFRPGSMKEARHRLGWGAEPVVLFIGRIQPLKGVDVAIEAFAVVRDKLPEARLVVVGGPSGPRGAAEGARLRLRVKSLGLEAAVAFHAPVPHYRLADFYRAANVLVLPSRSESFGLVAAEAAASGLPVVAARVGGLTYAVKDGETGFLIDGWEPADYADAVVRILDDPQHAGRLGGGGVAWSEAFSWEATADRYLELYRGMLSPD